MGTELVDLLEDEWRALDSFCDELSSEDWSRPTDCPGWSVKDIVSHLAGTEWWLLGRPLPNHEPESTEHVRNEIGRVNEVQVDSRRRWPSAQVLGDFREATRQRLSELKTWTEDDLAAASWTPFGPGTAERLIESRLADTWIHEQDIRRAVDRPGHFDDSIARHVLGDLKRSGLGYVVAKKAGCPDETAIALEVGGPAGFTTFVTVSGGRGKVVEATDIDPQATIRMDQETFLCLTTGRWEPDAALDDGRVSLAGDEETARRVVLALNFMF